MKIRQKILIGYFIVLAVFAITGLIGITNMHRMQASYAELIDHRFSLVSETKDFLTGFEYEALMMRTYFITGQEEWAQEYKKQLQEDDIILDRLQNKLSTDDERELFDKLSKTVKLYNENYAGPMMNIRSRSDLSEQQKVEEIARFTLEQKGTVRGVIRSGEDFVNFQQSLLEEAVQSNALWVMRVTTATTLLAVATLMLGLAAALYISRVIADPVKQLEMETKRIAEGDLTLRELPATSKDEVGNLVRSFGKMNERLHNLAERMQQSANLIADYTRELQASTQNAAQTARATSGKMTGLSETMKDMVEGSRNVVESSTRAATGLGSVEEIADKFLQKMDSSNAVTVRASMALKELEERLGGVGEIIQFITLIAEQASLLSKKAITEVAYVTEDGGTFVDLADEIQKRAQEASGAAKGINALIKNVHQHSCQALSLLEEDHAIVKEGYAYAKEASGSIRDVLKELQVLAKQVQDVAGATKQVAEWINQIIKTSEEQNTLVEGFAVATGALNRAAGELQSTVTMLKL